MLHFYGCGYLGADVTEVSNGKSGKLYRVSVAFNRLSKDKEQVTTWASGLVGESKVINQLHLLKKGNPVMVVSNNSGTKTYRNKDGVDTHQLDLGFIQSIKGFAKEGASVPPDDSYQPSQQAPTENKKEPYHRCWVTEAYG